MKLSQQRLERCLAEVLGSSTTRKLHQYSVRLAREQADIYVLLARKAVCLVDMFKHLGWPVPQGQLLSDRVIEFMPPEQLQGKRVVIADDIVIVGSTIHAIAEDLRAKGAVVTTCAFAIDEEWLVPELFKPSGSEICMSDRESSLFCSQLVDAISLIGRPYAVDFPMLRFPLDPRALSVERWNVIAGCSSEDVSTAFHRKYQQQRLVVHVNRSMAVRLLHSVGCGALAEHLEITKLRIYASELTRQLTVMPLATFDSIPMEDLRAAIPDLLQSELPKQQYNCILDALTEYPTLGHRAFTYLCSYALGRAIMASWLDLQDDQGLLSHVRPDFMGSLDERDMGLCLGPVSVPALNHCLEKITTDARWCQDDSATSAAPSVPSSLSPMGDSVSRAAGDSLHEGGASSGCLVTDIADYFLSIHRKIEIPSRRALKAGPWDHEASRRLRKGLTCRDMVYLLGTQGWDFKDTAVRRHLSRELDYLIDKGAVVPGVASDETGRTFRYYRPGEDLHFLDKHFLLLCNALQQAFSLEGIWNQKSVKEARELHIEKLLVALLKYMHALRIGHVLSEPRAGRLIRIGFSRMGAIAETARKDTLNFTKSELLRRYLHRKHYLTQDGVNQEAVIRDFQTAIPVEIGDQANLDVFAVLWTQMVIGHDDGAKRRAIVMASCSNVFDALAAMFEDLRMCLTGDGLGELQPLPDLAEAKYADSLKTVGKWGHELGGKRKLEVDNFHLKYTAWQEQRVNALVSTMKGQLGLKSTSEAIAWESAWSTMDPPPSCRPEPAAVDDVLADLTPVGFPLWRVVTLAGDCARFAAGGPWNDGIEFHLSEESVADTEAYLARLQGREGEYGALCGAIDNLRTIPMGKGRIEAFQSVATHAYTIIDDLRRRWNECGSGLCQRLEIMRGVVYGDRLTEFQPSALVWYDVKDSRAKRHPQPREHIERVERFKREANSWVIGQMEPHEGKYVVCDGDDESYDDEKHIYVNTPDLVHHFGLELFKLARSCKVCLRIVMCSCASVDHDLKVRIVGDGPKARATGQFYNWLADIKTALKEHGADTSHSVFYQDDTILGENRPHWPHSQPPEYPAREATSLLPVSFSVGGHTERMGFRHYEQG